MVNNVKGSKDNNIKYNNWLRIQRTNTTFWPMNQLPIPYDNYVVIVML